MTKKQSIFPIEMCFSCGHPYEVILPFCPKCGLENKNEQDALKILELRKQSLSQIKGQYMTGKSGNPEISQENISKESPVNTSHQEEEERPLEPEGIIKSLDVDTQSLQENREEPTKEEDKDKTQTSENKKESLPPSLWSWNTTFRLLAVSLVIFFLGIITLFFHSLSRFLFVIFLSIGLIVIPLFLIWRPKAREDLLDDEEDFLA